MHKLFAHNFQVRFCPAKYPVQSFFSILR